MPVRPTLLALLLPLALLLGGCAGAPAPPGGPVLPKYYDPRALLADVGARMLADGGALLSVSGTLAGPSGPVPVTGDGALRVDPARPGAEPAVRLDLRTGGDRTGLVRVAGRTWVRPAGDPPAARWRQAGRDPLPAGVGPVVAANVAAAADPLADVGRYADAVLVADAVDEPLDGVATVHYTLVVDLVRALATEADPVRRAALAAQREAGTTRIGSEVWLDAGRHPVQARIRRSLPGAGTLDALVRYRDWGSAVRVEPPPGG